MIEVNFNGESYTIPSEPNEIMLGDFDFIFTQVNNENTSTLEKYVNVFTRLGLPMEVIDEMSGNEFALLVKNFNGLDMPNDVLLKDIEIEGFKYVAHDGEFNLKTRQLIEIEKCAKKGIKNFPSMIMAIIFQREDLTKKEHFSPAHLELKSKLFGKYMTSDFAIPYIALVAKQSLKNIEDAGLAKSQD